VNLPVLFQLLRKFAPEPTENRLCRNNAS